MNIAKGYKQSFLGLSERSKYPRLLESRWSRLRRRRNALDSGGECTKPSPFDQVEDRSSHIFRVVEQRDCIHAGRILRK